MVQNLNDSGTLHCRPGIQQRGGTRIIGRKYCTLRFSSAVKILTNFFISALHQSDDYEGKILF